MRFEPIETLPNACPLFVEEAYDALVNDLGIKAWHWHQPNTMSELERFLLHGSSRSKRGDFFDLPRHHVADGVFDHSICFKGETGAPFVLTMPYSTSDRFYRDFNWVISAYYYEKAIRTDNLWFGYEKEYRTENWRSQFMTQRKITATIVPDRFKLRYNGDFAAIIAMDHWMHFLSELGGFRPVNADGVER